MSEIKVNSIKGVGASSAAITVNNTDGTCTANLTNRTNKNLIINGAMQVAQRSTDVTDANAGYHTVDRIHSESTGADEAPRRQQVDVSSSSTPYTLGFRKAFKLTNGNQTSGAGAGDIMNIRYNIEAQDMASSGWNYTSTSSFVTLQFWIKSSVSQNFNMYLRSRDGTNQTYAFDTGTLSADTWTKITKTIPGNSNIQFDNDNGQGLQINMGPFWGTDRTDNSVTNNVWQTYSSAARMKDNTTTWYTTNDSTLEITGLQLEVGSHATDFEHRSFAQELALCQRYYYVHLGTGNAGKSFMNSNQYSSNVSYGHLQFACTMRTTPSLDIESGTEYYGAFGNSAAQYFSALSTVSTSVNGAELGAATTSFSQGHSIWWRAHNANSRVAFTAEL